MNAAGGASRCPTSARAPFQPRDKLSRGSGHGERLAGRFVLHHWRDAYYQGMRLLITFPYSSGMSSPEFFGKW